MCKQKTVLEKIRKANKVNGYGVELAEAQIADYVSMQKDIKNLKNDVATIMTDVAVIKGNIDLIIARLNSPVEQERLDGQKWNLITSIAKHKAAWVILALVLVAFALAGDRMASLVGDIIRKMIGG